MQANPGFQPLLHRLLGMKAEYLIRKSHRVRAIPIRAAKSLCAMRSIARACLMSRMQDPPFPAGAPHDVI